MTEAGRAHEGSALDDGAGGAPAAAGRARLAALLAVPLLGTLLVFLPVTGCYFFGDDFVHLIDVVNEGVGAVMWRPYMGHLYVLPTVVYAALWQVAGMRTDVWYGLLLGVHLVNVALFFTLARTLTGSARVASLGALAWGACPLHAGTLAWFCVHGQALGTTALLLGLNALAAARAAGRPLGLGACTLVGLALLAGATGFGTTLATAIAFPVAALVCAGPALGRAQRAVLLASAVAALGWYVAAHRAYPVIMGPHASFSVGGALQDPSRMLAPFLSLIGVSLSALAGAFASIPPLFPTSREAFWTTPSLGVALAAALLVVVGTALAGPERRRWLLALALLAGAAYGAVALGRVTNQAIFGLSSADVAQTPRYHYAGSTPLALMLTLAAATVARRWRLRPAAKDACCAAAVVAWLVAFAASDWHMDLRAAARRETEAVRREAVMRARGAPAGATVAIADRRFNPMGIWRAGYTSAGVFTLFHPSDALDGRRVRYLPNARWSPATPPAGSLLARLLAPPDAR